MNIPSENAENVVYGRRLRTSIPSRGGTSVSKSLYQWSIFMNKESSSAEEEDFWVAILKRTINFDEVCNGRIA